MLPTVEASTADRAISLADLAGSVVRVGDGRGFVVRTRRANYIITAAHVLPELPPARLLHSLEQETYPRLIGPLHSVSSSSCGTWRRSALVTPRNCLDYRKPQ